jgi:hypothetical protein
MTAKVKSKMRNDVKCVVYQDIGNFIGSMAAAAAIDIP